MGSDLHGITVQDYGDSAVLLTAHRESDEENWQIARQVDEALSVATPAGVRGTIASYDAVLVEFDCTVTTRDAVVTAIETSLRTLGQGAERNSRTFVVPVAYGGEHGPDLTELAAALDVTEAEVVRLHSAEPHLIRAVLSPAGAPMSDMRMPKQVGRRASPRVRVPAGTVALAGRQATIYATTSPGGWQLIGRTPLTLFDVTADPPVRYRTGDRLRYVPIPVAEFDGFLGARIELDDE